MKNNLLFSQTAALSKTLGKRLAMVLTMLLIVGIGQAWGADVTFTANQDKGTTTNTNADSMTKSGITISSTSAGLAYSEYRFYNGTITISSTAGNITKVVFTCTENKYVSPLADATPSTGSLSASGTTVTWTGSSSSFTIRNTAQTRASKIVVTTASSTPTLTTTTSEIDFSNVAINSTSTQTFTFSGSNLTADATLAITGTNESYFSVNTTTVPPSSGSINNKSITVTYEPTAVGEHTATLTISSSGATSKTITLNGNALQEHTVRFFSGGEEVSSKNILSGSTIGTLPSATSCDLTNFPHFVGWTESIIDGTTTTKPTIITTSTPISSNKVYHAVFADKEESTGSGTTGSTTFAPKGSSKSSPWSDNGSTWTFSNITFANSTSAGFSKNGTATVTLPTGAVANTITITRTSNSWSGKISLLVKTGSTTIQTLTQPSTTTTINLTSANQKNTYTFSHNNAATNVAYVDNIKVNYTIPATPTIVTYITSCTTETSVTLHPNGGSGETTTETIKGTTYTVPDCPFSRLGYTFANWNTKENGTGNPYDTDATINNLDGTPITLYAQWTCETPVFDIKIKNDNPVIFSGETIELTVVGSNIATDATYQWYKGEDEIVGKTTDKLTIANATADDASNYKCEVSNATCSAENNYTVKMYHIKGLTDGTWTTPFEFVKSGDKEGTFSVELAANTTYYFKLNDGSVWYWNEGTMTHNNCTDWVIEQEGADTQGKANTRITTTASGTYIFTLNYEDPSKPELSVIYPAKRIVYLEPNIWASDNPKFAVHAWGGAADEDVLMTKIVDCADRNIYFAEIDAAHTHVIFIRGDKNNYSISNPWNNVWNRTVDLTLSNNNLFYVDNWNDANENDKSNGYWKNFTPNYSVTFDANGHGTAPADQCIAEGGKVTTPAAPTATGYTFGGWYKEAGCTNAWDFANDVVTSDITLYAKWTINTHTVTWKPAGGNWSDDASDIVQEYKYGAVIEAPDKPTYGCHEFVEWEPTYTAGMTMPDEDLVFTATWNKLSYTITFQNWDGSELQSSTVECGETPSYAGATPTREQTAQYTYTFKGWSPTIAPATEDQVYTALFNQTTRSYTVIWYDGTGNAHKTQTADYNATVALPTTNPDPCDDEYPHFIGWIADPIVGSTTTQPALVENVKVTGDCDYYAVFAKGEAGGGGSYVLDYSAENLGSSNKWGSYGTAYTHTAKDGSTWVIKAYKSSGMQINTGKNASIKIPSCPSPITSIEITGSTAKAVGLSASDYTGSGTITYIVTGQDNKSQTLDFAGKNVTNGYIVAKSGSISITKITVNFTAPTNYTSFITTCCTSWTAPTLTYTTPLEENGTAMPQLGAGTTHGTVTYASSNPSILSVNSTTGEISAQAPGTATVTATWSGDETYCSVSSTSNVITVKGSFSVIFEANGGTGTMANQKADENNNIAQLNANQFTRTGYAFVGWNTSSYGTGTAYTDQQTNITLAQNLTLYAQWAAIVTLNDAGNVITTHPETAGGSITLEDGANACDPYEFVGWTAVATGDWNEDINEPALVATTYTPNAPTTLYAVYKIQSEGNPNAFKLSYEVSGTTYYVRSINSDPYIKGFSDITADDAVTFYKEKIENNTEKYWVYFEKYDSYYDETTKEYLYLYNGNDINTTNSPSETQGWILITLSNGLVQFKDITYDKYFSFTAGGNLTDHSAGSQKSFNLLPAVSSTYYAIPDCDVEIKITFETGNGDFIANTPATNPLVVTPGETITLPTCDYPGDGIEFIGWLKNTPQEELSDAIADGYYEGGKEYLVEDTRDVIFYAYYKVTPEEVEFTGQDDAELKIYHYNGVDNYYYANTFIGEHAELAGIKRCFDATTWKFTNVGYMQYYIQDETGKYLGAVNDKDNDLSLSNTPKIWNFKLIDGLWQMICEDSPSRALMYISTGKTFANAALSNIIGNSAYSYVTLGICPDDGYTTNPVLSQGFYITNTAMVTSASGQKVKATSALTLETRNIELPCTFTIAAPNITFYDNTGAEVTQLTASAASEQFELHFAYKPTAENTMEYPTITITDDEMKTYTIKNRIYARSLPNTFAVVAKVGGIWYALPSQGLNSTTPPAAYPVEVDNMADPTAVAAVPANADWSLRQVYEASRVDATKDRFVANGENLVFVNNEGTPKALNASASGNYLLTDAQYSGYYETNPGLYEWTPTTSDLETYTLTNAQRTDRTLNVSINTVFGVHYDNKATTEVRFLPIQGRYKPMAAQVVEWKENSVVIMYNGDPAQTASVSVNGGAVQTTELSGDGVQKDIAVYELTANGLATNPTQRLSITIGTEKVILSIPYIVIVSGAQTDLALLPQDATVAARQDIAKVSDLVILKGATLTAAGAKSNPYKFRNVTVYGGGKLVIPSEKGFGVASLTLRAGGITDAGEYDYVYDYVYPQFELRGTFTNSAAKINLDYLTTKEQYYTFVAPFDVNTKDIKYPVDIYGSNVAAENTGSFEFQYYDGAARAEGKPGWKVVEEGTDGATLTAGKGYTFLGMPKKVSINGGTSTRQKFGIHRIPMSVTADAAMDHENNEQTAPLSVHLCDKNNNSGWNLIGNPYMTTIGGLTNDDIQVGKLVHTTDANGNWTGGWHWDDPTTGQRFLVFPSNDGQSYGAVQASNATLPAFKNFFVQIGNKNANALSIPRTTPASPLQAPAHHAEEVAKDVELAIVLEQDEEHTDQMDLLINNIYTANFERDADFTKMMNATNLNLYGVHPYDNLSFVAMDHYTAEQSVKIGYQVPQAGEYTLRMSEKLYVMFDKIEALYVTDHEMSPEVTTDIISEPYRFTVKNAETNNERFTISLKLKSENQGPTTGWENIDVGKDQSIKFIHQDRLYILRDGVIYDATGQEIQTINK